jgi:prefoldin beta subunit
MDLDNETKEKINELQILEHNLQNIMMQKQAFQFELSETEHALSEIGSAQGDIFKLIGQIMIKSSKDNLQKELTQKKSLLELRIKSIESQEKPLEEETEKIRAEIMKKIQ